jgi:hypothetical protein
MLSTFICRVESGQLGRDSSIIVFTFTFEYENKIEFEKVGNENELAGYPKI